MTKLSICILFTLSSLFTYAETKFCGHLTSLVFMTDIYTDIRMGIYNSKNNPPFITVKDESAIELTISVIRKMPNYTHQTDMDDFYWVNDDSDQRFFVCVEGEELREYQSRFYMDKVYDLDLWSNGVKL